MGEFFQRIEKKYVINNVQYNNLINVIKENFIEDEYGNSTIYNIYFDTSDFNLIQHSIERPVYKDKIRLRCYNVPKQDSKVYMEIKRKYNGIVSKRRISKKFQDINPYIEQIKSLKCDTQIEEEIQYYFKLYNLKPKMFVSYNRDAFYCKNDRNFRITFDQNIIARNYDFFLDHGNYGTNILENQKYIMEIKTLGAIPIWFTKQLNNIKIYPSNFSKYGEAYKQLIMKKAN